MLKLRSEEQLTVVYLCVMREGGGVCSFTPSLNCETMRAPGLVGLQLLQQLSLHRWLVSSSAPRSSRKACMQMWGRQMQTRKASSPDGSSEQPKRSAWRSAGPLVQRVSSCHRCSRTDLLGWRTPSQSLFCLCFQTLKGKKKTLS